MATPSRGLALARDAIEIVVRRLTALPASAEVVELRAKANEYLREVKGWSKSPPTVEERERLMKRALGLHVEVAKVKRAGS